MGEVSPAKSINRDLLTVTVIKRFVAKVLKTDGCWEWQGSTSKGYGLVVMTNKLTVLTASRGRLLMGIFLLTCASATSATIDAVSGQPIFGLEHTRKIWRIKSVKVGSSISVSISFCKLIYQILLNGREGGSLLAQRIEMYNPERRLYLFAIAVPLVLIVAFVIFGG